MALYKLKEVGVWKRDPGVGFNDTPDNPYWAEYQIWLDDGNTPDPIIEVDDVLHPKLGELKTEYNSRCDSATGLTNGRTNNKEQSKHNRILRKESKGNASANDIEYLDNKDILDEYLDELDTAHDEAESYLEDPIRTIQEIQDYDVVTDPNWPIV